MGYVSYITYAIFRKIFDHTRSNNSYCRDNHFIFSQAKLFWKTSGRHCNQERKFLILFSDRYVNCVERFADTSVLAHKLFYQEIML